MKLRKILPLLGIATVALLALSSCDDMLRGLFPAETGQLSGQGNDSITVNSNVYYYDLDLPGTGNLRVELYDSGMNLLDVQEYSVYETGYDVVYYKTAFNFLPDGLYYVSTYIDQNGDGQWDDVNWGALQDPVTVTANTSNQNVTKSYDVY